MTGRLWRGGMVFGGLMLLWGLASRSGIPHFLLPSPLAVAEALWVNRGYLGWHTLITLSEILSGLALGVTLGVTLALGMILSPRLQRWLMPLVLTSQAIPVFALAPLLVLWLGYGILPKVVLIVITCFFPMTIGLLSGFASADGDLINLMRAMGATKGQIFRYVKLPSSAEQFFSGLRISASYSVVGAVIAEWLGGFEGLGVYMMRVKKSYSFDKMFAVILLISIISLLLIKAVDLIKKRSMPWVELHPADN